MNFQHPNGVEPFKDPEPRMLYLTAYYQRRLNQCLGLFLLVGIMAAVCDHLPVYKSSVANLMGGLLVLGSLGYGAYCYLRLKALFYTWWATPLFLILMVAYPLLLVELVISYFVIRSRYKKYDVPVGFLGVSTETLEDLKAKAELA